MLRTYDRFASPPECAATSNARCGGGVIGAKDRPGNLTGASDPEVVAWAKQGREAAFRELVRRYERPIFSLFYRAPCGTTASRCVARSGAPDRGTLLPGPAGSTTRPPQRRRTSGLLPSLTTL